MTEYIDLTPTWEEILPTWFMLYESAIRGECTNNALVLDNAKQQFKIMAQATDKWNSLCKTLATAEAKAIEELRFCQAGAREDPECAHSEADAVLLTFISLVAGEDIPAAYREIKPKWYA